MNGYNGWSYTPYEPFLFPRGEISLCRVAPAPTAIRVEWLGNGNETEILFRKRGEGEFCPAGSTKKNCFDLTDLVPQTDYEFYLRCGDRKSAVRLARTGEPVGTVVNYLHPDDPYYSFSGRYLCSPSLLRHPDGYLLASMDLFAGQHPQNLTLIYRSDDGGKTWYYLSELMPCFWGKLFLHKGQVYMLACSTEYGDLLIGRSDDGGKTFAAPTVLLRGANGKNGSAGVHKNPQPLLSHKGRLYGTLEWGSWKNKEYGHAAMVMSCDENADLLNPESWAFTPPKPFPADEPALTELAPNTMTIEGTLTITPDGTLLNVMRFGMQGKVLAYEVNPDDPHAPLTYYGLLDLDTTYSKFMIKYDPPSGFYWSIISRRHEGCGGNARNLLSLTRSPDLKAWETVEDLLDFRTCNEKEVGFQYVDFEFDGDDIIFLCRTALNGAANFHDSNYSTFHRISAFRTKYE